MPSEHATPWCAQDVAPLAASVAAAAAAAARAVASADAAARKVLTKALRKALAAAPAGEAGCDAPELDAQLEALQRDGAAAAAAAADARAPFVWADGPLVTAMRRGDMILIDEINLAEDAVLERLNRRGRSGAGRGGWGSRSAWKR
jgi:midasin